MGEIYDSNKQINIRIMNKSDLVKILSGKMAVSHRDALYLIDIFTQSLTEMLEEGESLQLQGFGTFSLWKQTERVGRNPKTGEVYLIPPRSSVKFKPGKNLLKDLNGRKA